MFFFFKMTEIGKNRHFHCFEGETLYMKCQFQTPFSLNFFHVYELVCYFGAPVMAFTMSVPFLYDESFEIQLDLITQLVCNVYYTFSSDKQTLNWLGQLQGFNKINFMYCRMGLPSHSVTQKDVCINNTVYQTYHLLCRKLVKINKINN